MKWLIIMLFTLSPIAIYFAYSRDEFLSFVTMMAMFFCYWRINK